MSNQPSQDRLDLVYGLDDRPKPFVAFLAAFQHLLAIIVPIVTPGLLICLALGVPRNETNMILSMSLVISGIATFLQCKKSVRLVQAYLLFKVQVLTLLARLSVLAVQWSLRVHQSIKLWLLFLVL